MKESVQSPVVHIFNFNSWEMVKNLLLAQTDTEKILLCILTLGFDTGTKNLY